MQERGRVIFVAIVLLISLAIGGCNSVNSAETIKVEKKSFPDHPITLIVPFGAGGTMDLQARMLESKAQKYMGEAMVVVNKPGGGGVLGWNDLGSSAPDGYTLAISGPELLLQPMFADTRYDYPSALEPLAQISSAPFLLVVNADAPWRTVDELVQYARQHPGSIKFGHGGIGSFSHIVGKAFAVKAGIQIEEVPFRGSSECTAALLGNHVQVIVASPAPIKEQVRVGKLRVLALSSKERSSDPVLAQSPTFKEAGYDVILTGWFGVCAPKMLPDGIKSKLEVNLKKIILDPEFRHGLANMGLQAEYLNAEESQIRWSNDLRQLQQMVDETGVLEQVKAQKGQGN